MTAALKTYIRGSTPRSGKNEFTEMNRKLQNKLIRILFFSSIIPLAVIALVTIYLMQRISLDNAYERVHKELSVGRKELRNIKEVLKYIVREQNNPVASFLEANALKDLEVYLQQLIETEHLSFFTVTDPAGRVVMRASNPQLSGDDLNSDLFIRRALEGITSVFLEVLPEEELRQEGLFDDAIIELSHSGAAEQIGRPGEVLSRGMVIKAALPVMSPQGRLIGAISSGYLVNRSDRLIDRIYELTGLPSSIFLDDIRIASNVHTLTTVPVRFIGTRADTDVKEQALERGQIYSGRKDVAGTWYLAAYEPIYDINNRIIGMYGIGIDEKLVFALRDSLIQVFIIAVLLTIIAALGIGIFASKGIVNSISRLRKGTEAISKGDFDYRINIDSEDEVGQLAGFFNQMAAELKSTRGKLQEHARELEDKVTQRTAQLEATQQQLLQCERVAAMGRIASALSHELKNVFTGIQTSAYYLKGKVLKEYPKLAESFSGIEKEIRYASGIINDVLNFTRPRKMRISEIDLNLLINDLLSSPGQKELLKDIEVHKNLEPDSPRIKADELQLREVILNLLINAAEAMPAGGKLRLVTKNQEGFLRIEVADTGSGIPEENAEQLFVPFFTTKSRGLGLGLSICKEIIERHSGRIEFESAPGDGAKFIIFLPLS